MSLFNELQNLMIKHRFRPNKKLGQHFVVDQPLLERLVGLAELKQSDKVLEIGSGTGFLTRRLLEKCPVFAFEADDTLCILLEKELNHKNLHLECRDFLKAELPEFNKVVSLPPYSKSAAIVYRLLLHGFELGVLVFQKEFAQKLVALPGFEEYCALSVLTQQCFEPEIMQKVPSSSFFPRPKYESCIVRLKAHERFGKMDRGKFMLFVKTIFRFKNKNLRNALGKSQQFLLPKLKMEKRDFEEKAKSLDFQKEKVYLLSVSDFASIFRQLTS